MTLFPVEYKEYLEVCLIQQDHTKFHHSQKQGCIWICIARKIGFAIGKKCSDHSAWSEASALATTVGKQGGCTSSFLSTCKGSIEDFPKKPNLINKLCR